jgi:hypothetical protein
MSRPVPDAKFIHGVLMGLAFAAAASAAGLVYSLIAVPTPFM